MSRPEPSYVGTAFRCECILRILVSDLGREFFGEEQADQAGQFHPFEEARQHQHQKHDDDNSGEMIELQDGFPCSNVPNGDFIVFTR